MPGTNGNMAANEAADQTRTFLQYMGIAGATKECVEAVERLLLTDAGVRSALILTHRGKVNPDHALRLTIGHGDEVIVKSGFSSGYGGAGPNGFSHILHLLDWHGAELDEVEVGEDIIERLDASALTLSDVEYLETATRLRPMRLWEYILEPDDGTPANPWRRSDPFMPMAIFDDRLAQVARDFWRDPDGALLKGHRQLEEAIRVRAGISTEEATGGPARMYSLAFNGERPRLTWPDITKSEHSGRMNLFMGTLNAYRHVRAHRSQPASAKTQLGELLLLNHLFLLEAEACPSQLTSEDSQ